MKAIITMGLPGSGKTTYIKNNYPDANVSSADHHQMDDGVYKWRPERVPYAHGMCLKNFIWAVKNRIPCVACENTNTTIAELAPYVAIAQAYGYEVEIVWLNSPKAFSRQLHGVPRETWDRMAVNMVRTTSSDWPRHWPRFKCVDT